jgi:hypothetical protein
MLRQHTSALYLLQGLLGLVLASSTAQNVVSVSVVLIPAIETAAPTGTQPGAAPSLVSSATTGITTHGPYSGTPTTTGAEKGPATISATIPSEPNPWATYYNPNGKLTAPQPMPYMPAGKK